MVERRSRGTARPLAAALAALALAGCSATHVGDDWQCPLAQGKVCASVAAADPAVPETRGAANPAHGAAPYRRSGGRIAAGTPAGSANQPACETDCNPFAWLGSLFAGFADAGSADPEPGGSPRNSHVETPAPTGQSGDTAAQVADAPRDSAAPTGHPASGASATDSTVIAPAVPGDALHPVENEADGSAGAEDAPGPAFGEALRTGEVVARIWIAPFVDEEGIYREGSWVRAVIAPAAWRLP
ncbi:MAG: TraV family lipoprotein [Rhodospirillales bacterium]|nr:TraV family lipoprotein [Rhodospirillales bacterium]